VGRQGVECGGESEGREGENGPGQMSLTHAGKSKDEDEGESVGGHQGMEERCEGEDECGIKKWADCALVVDGEGYGQQ
jgi:hypothetical protein